MTQTDHVCSDHGPHGDKSTDISSTEKSHKFHRGHQSYLQQKIVCTFAFVCRADRVLILKSYNSSKQIYRQANDRIF